MSQDVRLINVSLLVYSWLCLSRRLFFRLWRALRLENPLFIESELPATVALAVLGVGMLLLIFSLASLLLQSFSLRSFSNLGSALRMLGFAATSLCRP